MKRILFISGILFFALQSFAQDKAKCEKIVNSVFEAVNKQDVEQIKPYLSDKFEMAGHGLPIAEKVLEQMVNYLGSVKNFNLINSLHDQNLVLSYDVEYENFGKSQALFEFDTNHKIRKLEFLKAEVQVKTIAKDEQNIDYNSANMIQIPFTMMGNLVVVKASINGEERDFILDSGTAFTIINSKYLEDTVSQNKTSISGSRGVTNHSITGVDIQKVSVNFYGIKTTQQKTLTLDVSHLEDGSKKIYGLIGQDFIKEYDVLFDYKNKVITLIKPDYFETYKKEHFSRKDIDVIAMELRGHIPVLPIKIGEKSYKMGIDCGGGGCLLDINLLGELRKNVRRIRATELVGISQNKATVIIASLKRFYAGSTLYKRTRTVFNDISHLNKDKKIKIDGLLGYEFLSKQLTLLSYHRKEVLLIK
ncbi:MAG: hypothetical protein CR989_05125 [Flavobacteriales bacterium]|nr:MAG: hypothetical protein CR989_05125 [Flavobacteriales bacterium]